MMALAISKPSLIGKLCLFAMAVVTSLEPAIAADECTQTSAPIETDRPDITNSSVVVPVGSFQNENGINFSRRDKALIVVACPKANIPGSFRWQMKMHANDSVIAVNRPGTYSFAYVDPGEYLLASEAGFAGGNVNGFKMKLEAGNDYYFLQNITVENRTVLSVNPRPIVLLEIGGASFSEWKQKP